MSLLQTSIYKYVLDLYCIIHAEDGRRGSNVYEVNPWLWQFGRGKPRIGGLTIKETEERKEDARKSSDTRRKETRAGRKGDRASK
jgi:hypothetical protein